MRATTFLLTALAFAASTLADSVPEGIEPEGESPPDGCERTVDGNFTIGIAVLAAKHRRETAAEAAGSALACTLKDGVLKDQYGRVGSVVANYQFQFDGPPQAGAIYTGGFSRCDNGSLAIGDSTIWYRCMSGAFGNLYDRWIGEQCSDVRIVADMLNEPSSSSSSSVASSTSMFASKSSAASSTWSVISATASANSTMTTGAPSNSGSGSASITSSPTGTEADSTSAPSSESADSAAATRIPKRETFGAVVGILGAALMF